MHSPRFLLVGDRLGLFGMPLHPPHRSFGDTYAEDADRIIYADEAGFDEVYVANMGPHYRQMIALHGEQVLPRLRDWAGSRTLAGR